MHTQLEILLQIQDLKTQRRELVESEGEGLVEVEEFRIDVDDARRQLDQKITELEGDLAVTVRGRYQRIVAGRERAVVPVIGGICYGCFVSIPISVATDIARNDELRNCDHCGRFVYVID